MSSAHSDNETSNMEVSSLDDTTKACNVKSTRLTEYVVFDDVVDPEMVVTDKNGVEWLFLDYFHHFRDLLEGIDLLGFTLDGYLVVGFCPLNRDVVV